MSDSFGNAQWYHAGMPASGGQEMRPAERQAMQPPYPTTPPKISHPTAPTRFVIVTGRARTAGWLVLGGGAALLLSAFLPWFSFLGIVGAHLPAGYFLAFGAVGSLLAYFGIRALKDRVTHAIMRTLWVLAAIAAIVAVGVFAEGQNLASQSYGTVTPASGFYLGLLGLVSTVAGTILLQTTRRSTPDASGR